MVSVFFLHCDFKKEDNIFFHTDMKEKKILLIVPHQDDEINILGDLTFTFRKNGADVFVVFVTNGDYFIPGTIRIHEAVNSLAVLGVPAENVFFLGYPDAFNKSGVSHLYNAFDEPVVSRSGFNHTYGSDDFPDYAFYITGEHNDYIRCNLCDDLKKIILDIKADVIFCTDYDYHADHRMTSLCFEHVMGEILSRNKNHYKPIVFKSFAYCTAYYAVKDFFLLNLPETQLPNKNHTLSYFDEDDMIGHFIYDWDKRVRFPIRNITRNNMIFNNLIYRALSCHKSQRAALNFERIVSSDKVFWQRRTDNLVYSANIDASSNKKDLYKICDFLLYDANDINAMNPSICADGWKPDDDDRVRRLCFYWDEPKLIKVLQVAVYKNDEGEFPILLYSLNENTWIELGALPDKGKYLTFIFNDKVSVEQLELQFVGGKNFTVSDVGVYTNDHQCIEWLSVVKILLYDNFAYRYYLDKKQTEIPVRLYTFPKREDIQIVIYDEEGRILHNLYDDFEKKCKFIDNVNKYVVQAEDKNGKIYDRVLIERLGDIGGAYRRVILSYYERIFSFIQYTWPEIKHLIKKCVFMNKFRK